MLGDKKPVPSGPGTIVGTNVKLIGTIQDANDIIIHGQIEGEVASSQSITIAETAYVKGPITGGIVVVAGKVEGSITAASKLEIMPNGKVFGSVTTKDLSIKSGAVFVGKCNMPEHEKEAHQAQDTVEESKEPKKDKEYEVE